jgi:hypothetical protein
MTVLWRRLLELHVPTRVGAAGYARKAAPGPTTAQPSVATAPLGRISVRTAVPLLSRDAFRINTGRTGPIVARTVIRR